MGENADFNLQLNDTRKRFTYFVPRDWAWQQTEIEYPSAHKKLFMPTFSYQVRSTTRFANSAREIMYLQKYLAILLICVKTQDSVQIVEQNE